MRNRQLLQKEIDSMPVFELTPLAVKDGNGWAKQNEIKAVVVKGTTQAVSVVSNRYVLVQFKDIFDKVLGGLSKEVEGETKYYIGSGFMVVFPKGKKIGLAVTNSVDKSWAIHLRYCTMHNDLLIYIPTAIKGIRDIHVGKIKDTITNFMSVLDQTMTMWKTIVDKFSGYIITDEDFDEIMDMLKAGERLKKDLRTDLLHLSQISLWDLMLEIITKISEKDVDNTIAREKKLEKVSEVIYNYGITLNL